MDTKIKQLSLFPEKEEPKKIEYTDPVGGSLKDFIDMLYKNSIYPKKKKKII